MRAVLEHWSRRRRRKNGVLLRIFVPIIPDLEVWPYFSIMVLNSRLKGQRRKFLDGAYQHNENGCFAIHIWAK